MTSISKRFLDKIPNGIRELIFQAKETTSIKFLKQAKANMAEKT